MHIRDSNPRINLLSKISYRPQCEYELEEMGHTGACVLEAVARALPLEVCPYQYIIKYGIYCVPEDQQV